MENYYIFTEIVGCGKIGRIALDSFHKYHNNKVYVYGTKEDFKLIKENKNNIFVEVDDAVLDGYKSGHLGTAILWEKIISSCDKKFLLHFDSDTIFRGNIIDEILEKSKEYDIIGPIRNYHHNPSNRDDVRHLADLCQTNCTLWNLEKINKGHTKLKISNISLALAFKYLKYKIKRILGMIKISELTQKIHGSYPLFPYPTLDFFDQVMFEMIENGARIYHLDFNEAGGCDAYGKRDNAFKEINNFPTPYKLDFGSKLVHFSCVGSGMNFYQHRELIHKVGKEYFDCALDRYALFCKTFYNENLPDIPLEKYKAIYSIENFY